MLRNKPSHFSCLGIFIQAHRPQATWRRDLISVTTVSVENAARQSPETTICLSKTSDRSQGSIPVTGAPEQPHPTQSLRLSFSKWFLILHHQNSKPTRRAKQGIVWHHLFSHLWLSFFLWSQNKTSLYLALSVSMKADRYKGSHQPISWADS